MGETRPRLFDLFGPTLADIERPLFPRTPLPVGTDAGAGPSSLLNLFGPTPALDAKPVFKGSALSEIGKPEVARAPTPAEADPAAAREALMRFADLLRSIQPKISGDAPYLRDFQEINDYLLREVQAQLDSIQVPADKPEVDKGPLPDLTRDL